MNYFDIHGPLFLLCYFVFSVLAIAGAKMAYDQALTVPEIDPQPNLKPYEIAYLAGGSARVFLTAVAALTDRNILEIGTVTKTLSIKQPGHTQLDWVEENLVETCGTDGNVNLAYKKMEEILHPIKHKLMALQLIASDKQVNEGTGMAFGVLFSLPLLVGSFQLIAGIWAHRPVGFLVIMFTFSILAAFILPAVWGKQRLTSAGRSLLERMKQDNGALELNSRACPTAMSGSDLALAYGLFGAAAAGGSFMVARSALSRNQGGGGCGGGGCGGAACGGGSSGSSCGGGSCGGGGGCGGGCGGCGG